ncbi:MAG: UvrD-helicase domain-containing protein [Oligosphaeraceae bacterium]|nr:UvrD-helicase domain-containing protein [Oligosphaeraceae bacterium]
MADLNPQQQQAVDSLQGPLLLLAGAGTGKTTVIVQRIANLVRHGIRAEAILAVTFTNKAAREMRERVSALLGKSGEKITVSTFHSFCANVLRRHIQRLGFSRNFSIASDSYQNGLIREILAQEGLAVPGNDPALFLHRIGLAKAALQSPEDISSQDLPWAANLALVYRRYQLRLQQMDMLDFDDMLCLTVKLWQDCPDILQSYQQQYSHLLVDEYQDTNIAQLKIVTLLAGTAANVAVVGDDDQSIYGWRGANLDNILQFEAYFPNAKIIRLEQNYRSTTTILQAANAVIAKNRSRREKNLWSQQPSGEKILGVRCQDEVAEADFLAEYISSQVEQHHWRDFAVLFRSNHQARLLEERFRKAKVPYILVGTNSFYQSKEILDLISFLQIIQNPSDDLGLLRVVNVPPRSIGDNSIAKIREFRQQTNLPLQKLLRNSSVLQQLPPETGKNLLSFLDSLDKARQAFAHPGDLWQKASDFLTEVDYLNGLGRMYKPREDALRRRDNVLEFLNALSEFEEEHRGHATLQDFLENFALQDAQDKREKEKSTGDNAVTLMTVHAAKGLEFPTVLLAGLERNLFPHQRAVEEGNEEEERRLFYVAITRARKQFLFSFTHKRRLMGKVMAVRPSKFQDELPEELVVYTTPEKAIRPLTQEEFNQYWEEMKKMFETGPKS